MHEHRPIDLVQDVSPDLYSIVRAYAEDIAIERRMMQTAQRQSIWYDGLRARVVVRKDVRSVK